MTETPYWFIWYMAGLIVLGLSFVVSAALGWWAVQRRQRRLMEHGRAPELMPWGRYLVILKPELRTASITFVRTAYWLARKYFSLLFRPDLADPDLEILRKRAARLQILTLGMRVTMLIALALLAPLIVATES